jgi:hypothetical protein
MRKLILIIFSLSIFAISNSASAQKRQFVGDWITDIDGEINEAYVANDSKSIFGLICIDKCLWYVDFQRACEDGDKYTALMAHANSAGAIELTCLKYEKRHILILNDFTKVQNATLESDNLGFAIALQSGRFHVSRFSMKGARAAQERVVNASLGKQRGKSSGFKDQSL